MAMDDLVVHETALSSEAPTDAPVPPRVAAQLASLASARELTHRYLTLVVETAEALSPDERVELLAKDGQMTLNIARTDRALRQIVAIEQEVMGLREPAQPRGGSGGQAGLGGGGSGGGGGGKAGERLNDLNDLNEANDLGDLEEVKDIHDLLAVEDLGEIEDLDDYYDLAALEKYETYEEFERRRKADPDKPEPRSELEAKIKEVLARKQRGEIPKLEDLPPEERPVREDVPPEEIRRRIQEMNDWVRARIAARRAKHEAEWQIVRAALLRRRAVEKEARKRKKRGRGPP
jgi:hypothetical protein